MIEIIPNYGKKKNIPSFQIKAPNLNIVNNKDTIFINIPSYADSEIWSTIDSYFSKAKYPNRIFIGAVLSTFNFEEDNKMLEECKKKYGNKVNVKLMLPGDLIGCQPARKYIHGFYRGQSYYLNSDCHMRAMQNWDEDIINYFSELEEIKQEECIITSSIPAYWRENGYEYYDQFDPESTISYCLSDTHEELFKDRGVLQMVSQYLKLSEPMASPYISGGFFFTRGKYIERVPFVNKIVFSEEEIFMALRFFTAGLNAYIPTRLFLYHKFDRGAEPEPRRTIWADFPDQFYPMHESSRLHCVKVLSDNIVDRDNGLFNVRTVKQYEDLFGVDFKNRTVSENFKKGIFPKSFTTYQLDI